MLSVSKARQDYYLKKLEEVSPREDYYLKGGRATGWWRGSGAADLGLEGKVSTQALVRLFDGEDPTTGEQLGARLRKDGVGAWDLTFSADKSVSLLWALGDPEISREVRRAFDEATSEALAYLESVASSTRGAKWVPVLDEEGKPVVGDDGKAVKRTETWSIPTTGFVAASFTEFTSRLDDPQLHTHVVVGNKVKGVDGKWRAVDGTLIFRHKMAAGAIHEAELRSRLTQYLGVRWQPAERGLADITGFTRKHIDAFSERRKQIDAWRDAHELPDTAANSARAALATRSAKQDRPFGEVVIEWIERGEQVGLTDEAIERIVGRSTEVSTPDVDKLRRLVPQEVIPQGSVEGALQFGFELGTGVRTYLPSALPHAAVLATFLIGSITAGITVGLAFGVGRALMPLTRNGSRDPGAWDATLSTVSHWLRRACASALVLAAATIWWAGTT